MLLDAGFSVVPIGKNKRPCLSSWREYQRNPASKETANKWFTSCERIGILGGRVSRNFEVIDFDDVTAYESFEVVCGTGHISDILQSCCLIQTPSGGHHMYYRCDVPIAGNMKLARTSAGEVKIETRGEGGLVVTCPTDGYKILRGTPMELPNLRKTDVDVLHMVAVLFDDFVDTRPQIPLYSPTDLHSSAFKWYNAQDDYLQVLEAAGWKCIRCNANNHCMWCRPGKSDGVSATTGYNGRRGLYVFSSNAYPFDANRWYTPAFVYTLLECSGDLRAARARIEQMRGVT